MFFFKDIAGQQFGLGGVSSAGQRDSNFGSNSRQGQRDNFSNDFQPVEYRPFGSTRPCSSLINVGDFFPPLIYLKKLQFNFN